MIYIVSFGGLTTGGSETLHQAAYALTIKGEAVCMVYVSPYTDKIPDKFLKYNIEVAKEIRDDEKNILIVPETLTYFLNGFTRIRKVIWWLSVDFYEQEKPFSMVHKGLVMHHWPVIFWPAEFLILMLKRKIHFRYYRFKDKGEIFHLYNCEYAHQFILSRGVAERQTLYLCGPLSNEFFENVDNFNVKERENIVLYNPKKGLEYTNKIISNAKERKIPANFVALQDMTTSEIVQLMKRAKVYIDFGFFPGPERIPREAVMQGCNIITSKNGSAANSVDVPIPDEFKFDDSEENVEKIIDILSMLLQDYERYYPMFDGYRDKVKNQILLFDNNLNWFISHFIKA